MSYSEKRVRVGNFGVLDPKDPRVMEVPRESRAVDKKQWLHWRALDALIEMQEAAKADGIGLRISNGLRRKKKLSKRDWENATIGDYWDKDARPPMTREQARKKLYKFRAYSSPHETGLVVDFLDSGLAPVSRTNARQKKTAAHAWLVDNAYKYGYFPYKAEAWHWEYGDITKKEWLELPGGGLIPMPMIDLDAWNDVEESTKIAVGAVIFTGILIGIGLAIR